MFNQNFSNEFTETRIAVTVIPSHLANMSTISTSGSTFFQGQGGFWEENMLKAYHNNLSMLAFLPGLRDDVVVYVLKKREVEEDYHDKGCDFNLFLTIFSD